MILIDKSDPVLRRPAHKVVDVEFVRQFLTPMRELMLKHGGCGLAAPQVGIPLRFFITNISGAEVMINPDVSLGQAGFTSGSEGCLTFPGRRTYVRRSDDVMVHWTDPNGNLLYRSFSDFEARIIQHENDHLNGICIFS